MGKRRIARRSLFPRAPRLLRRGAEPIPVFQFLTHEERLELFRGPGGWISVGRGSDSFRLFPEPGGAHPCVALGVPDYSKEGIAGPPKATATPATRGRLRHFVRPQCAGIGAPNRLSDAQPRDPCGVRDSVSVA